MRAGQNCAIALRNAAVYREAVVQHERSEGLLQVIKALSSATGASRVSFQVPGEPFSA